MKKKILFLVALIMVISIPAVIFGSGFVKNTTVAIIDYSVDSARETITMDIASMSSMGYVRKLVVDKQEGDTLYLYFRGAFGGPNGVIGAKSRFQVKVDGTVAKIAFLRDNGYVVALEKKENGEWEKAK